MEFDADPFGVSKSGEVVPWSSPVGGLRGAGGGDESTLGFAFGGGAFSVTNATVVTAKNVEKLCGAVDLINAHAVTMKHVTTVACMMGISAHISHFFSGLDTLLSGHLSLSLVKKNVTEPQFVAFPQAVRAKGYMLLFPSFTQVFEFPVSYFVE